MINQISISGNSINVNHVQVLDATEFLTKIFGNTSLRYEIMTAVLDGRKFSGLDTMFDKDGNERIVMVFEQTG